MKKTIISAGVLSIFFSLAACNDNTDKTSSTATETTIIDSANVMNNDNKMSNDSMAMSSAFITEAAKGGMMEVELGKIAQQNAASKEVKDFGAMLVKDHSAANEELKAVAMQKNISLSDDLGEHKMHVDELRNKKGADFDKAYVDMMVEDHVKDIAAFETAANGSDAAISAFATKTLPVLRKHLGAVKSLQAKMMK